MNLKKILKNENGATAVIVALLMVVLLGAVAIVVDLGRGYNAKAQMQSACDLAALAGAKQLPDSSSADVIARQIAISNGYDPSEINVEVFDGNSRVRVTINQRKNTLFAGVIGVNDMNIGCSAVGSKDLTTPSNVKRVNPFFDYLLFHSGETGTLTLGTSGLKVYGGIHSNANIMINQLDTIGGFSSVGNFDGSVSCKVVRATDIEKDEYEEIGTAERQWWPYNGYVLRKKDGSTTPLHETVFYKKTDDLIEVPSSIMDAAMDIIPTDSSGNPKMPESHNVAVEGSVVENKSRVINGDIVIYGDGKVWCHTGNITVNGNIYCTGNLQLQRVTINGDVYCCNKITTSGENISFNGNYVYADSFEPGNGINVKGVIVVNHNFRTTGNVNQLDGGVAVLSLHGNIALTAGGQTLNGIVYAPEGSVEFGGGTVIHGNVIAKDLPVRSALTIYPMKQATIDDLGDMVTITQPGGSSGSNGEVKLVE